MRPPPIFWVFKSPSPAPQGPMGTTEGGGTSADIVPTQIIFGVDPCKRCWDIAQKPPSFPLTPIVTKISFAPFSARPGPPTPKRGDFVSRPGLRRHANFGVNRPTGCWEIVDRTKNKQKKPTVKQIPRLSLYERMAGNKKRNVYAVRVTFHPCAVLTP